MCEGVELGLGGRVGGEIGKLVDGLVAQVGNPGGELELILEEARALEEAVVQARRINRPGSSWTSTSSYPAACIIDRFLIVNVSRGVRGLQMSLALPQNHQHNTTKKERQHGLTLCSSPTRQTAT